MKSWLGIFASAALCLMYVTEAGAAGPAAAAKDEVLDSFNQQIALIDEVSESVDRDNLPALLAIRSSIGLVIEQVQQNRSENRKPVTFETVVTIQGLVTQYAWSETMLGWTNPPSDDSIYTEEKSEALMKLKNVAEEMKREYGFDKSFYTKITANTLMQMQRLLSRIEEIALDPQLKEQFRQMWVPIGKAAAKAKVGDRPKVQKFAMPVVAQMRALYPKFDQISTANAGFPVVMELKGLVEFTARYLQVDEDED